MACIIQMSSDKFLDSFIKKYDYKKFNFLLISEDVKTSKKYKNVYSIPTLLPPPNIVSEFVARGYTNKYVKKYVDYLQTPRVEAMITVLVKLCVIDNSNVILLCSKAENEFRYIDIICQYIENIYGVKTYTYKKYKKNPDKCEEISDKEKKKIVKVLEYKLNQIQDIESPRLSKKEAKSRFETLNKKELKAYLKSQGINYDSDDSKKSMIKKLLKEYE